MNVIFLGAPGSGKGTQAAMLTQKLKLISISTGEVLRKEVALQSEVGKAAQLYMHSGRLVPDEVVINIIKKQVLEGDCNQGFILDGFPRNIEQAIELDKMLSLINKKIDIVFNFEVPEEILIKRIAGRFFCKGCGVLYNRYFKLPKVADVCDECKSSHFESRDDDNEETVNNRLKIYHDSTVPLIEFYRKNNLLISIAAIKSAPLIFEELIEAAYKLPYNN